MTDQRVTFVDDTDAHRLGRFGRLYTEKPALRSVEADSRRVRSETPHDHHPWFDYHYISQEPTKKSVSVTVYDQEAVREVWGQDQYGDRVPMDPVPDWRAAKARVPVMQYVICNGEGEIVDRIPVRGSRRKQIQRAWTRLMVHMMAEP